MRYRYDGPGPQQDGEGGLVRPGDEREFSEVPDAPWTPVEEPEKDSEGGNLPGPPEASPAAVSAAPALNTTPAPAVTPEDM